jgi:phenylacetate-CoA ligase
MTRPLCSEMNDESLDKALTNAQRFPNLSERGRSTLNWMCEQPCAPRFNHHCGDRLNAEARLRVREFENALCGPREDWSVRAAPKWVENFARECVEKVPIYRRASTRFQNFFELPTTRRADLAREPWSFVPDGQSLDELILYDTSGTSGQPMEILAHPEFSAKYLPLLKLALEKRGVEISDGELGSRRVSQVLVCRQKSTFTFATLASYWNESGFVKLNLDESQWRDANHRAEYLELCDPLLLGGDPLSFAGLLELRPKVRPRALVSTAMMLSPALQEQLEEYFACPVINLYALNECGPLAVKINESEWEVLTHDVFVEILDENDATCARGEIVISGGRNPFLPILRYRTGDWAELENKETSRGTIQILKNLEGRAPVVFRGAGNQFINNIDVTKAFEPFPISQFALHQNSDASLTLSLRDASTLDANELIRALKNLFGEIEIQVRSLETQNASGKVFCYTSDLS